MRRRFLVAIPQNDGGVGLYPMKEWLRQHPEHVPPGRDATASTAWQLRDGLKKLGWSADVTETEVRMMMPGTTLPMPDDTDVGVDEQAADQEASFALEYQLRDFIAHNLHTISIPGRRLRLYVDPSGQNGIEYPSAVGPIDILAVDESGDLVVFELKRARSPDQAIGQLARYMGWVKLTIAEDRDVHGVVVAGTITENLRYAASVIPKVSLFEYAVQFHLKPASSVKQDR